MCRYYNIWYGMITRCYSVKALKRHVTYIDCYVCDEWLKFSNFKEWMINQDFKEKELDKDIKSKENKVYSPMTCLFVDRRINLLVNTQSRKGCSLPIGVVERILSDGVVKYISQCNTGYGGVYIGIYCTPEEAFEAYKRFKYEVIKEVALKQSEPLRSALLSYEIKPY